MVLLPFFDERKVFNVVHTRGLSGPLFFSYVNCLVFALAANTENEIWFTVATRYLAYHEEVVTNNKPAFPGEAAKFHSSVCSIRNVLSAIRKDR